MAYTPDSMNIIVNAEIENLAEIQQFIIDSMAHAFDTGVAAAVEIARDFIDPDSMAEFDEIENPYKTEEH